MELLIVLLVAVAVVAAWKFRVQIMARVLGQSEDRVRRQLERRRD